MQTVVLKLLPDGSGRVCIHWLFEHAEGPIETANALIATSAGPKVLNGKKWRMACNPKLSNITSQQEGSRIIPWTHSDDPRAATCPKCLGTAEYKAAMERLGEIVESMPQPQKGV